MSEGCDALGALAPPVFAQYESATDADLWVKPGIYEAKTRRYDGALIGEIRRVNVALAHGELLNHNPKKKLVLTIPVKRSLVRFL